MTQTTPVPTSSRHLIDPELTAALDAFPGLDLSTETLPFARAALSEPVEGAPDPQDLFPDVTRTEHLVPGPDGDPDVRVLYYEPKDRATTTAALVWIHGGGYVVGTADSDDLLCRRIATETGAVIASVDYRLAPETTAPGPVEDCYAVLRWVHANADTLGIDAARVAVGGASAGGGLAACLAILARDRGELPVAYQLLIYPMLDDRTSSTREAHPYAGEFLWTAAHNRFGWASLLGHEPGGEGVSPYAAAARVEDVAGLPPTFICVGALDLFLEEDVDYARRLLAAGVPTELHVYPGAYHGYDMSPEARVTTAHFRDLLGGLDRALNG